MRAKHGPQVYRADGRDILRAMRNLPAIVSALFCSFALLAQTCPAQADPAQTNPAQDDPAQTDPTKKTAQLRETVARSASGPIRVELPYTLESPDGELRLEVSKGAAVAEEQRLRARLLHGDRIAIESLSLGSFSTARERLRLEVTELDERYTLRHGKVREAVARARTLKISADRQEIELRLQNDGLAFRRHFDAPPISFRLPAGSLAWLAKYPEPSHTGPSYEEAFHRLPAGSTSPTRSKLAKLVNPLLGTSGLQITGADGWALPALFRTGEGVFLLVSEAGLELGHAGHHLENRGLSYRFAPPPPDQGLSEPDRVFENPAMSPWRIFMVGDLAALFASTWVTDVSPPERSLVPTFDWVRPARLAWDWWTHLETGPPERQRRHIDFAARMGFELVLIDANWHRWPDAEEQVRRLVDYGRERGVGLVLWYNSGGPNNKIKEGPRDRISERGARQAEFAKLALWGLAGVKVDFWHSDRAVRIAAYIELLEDAAENGLMVNVHGSTLPRGWRRTYPHLMTYEAVRGAEFYRFPIFDGPNALDHVRYALIRNVVGAMDYTPVVFDAALDDAKLPWAHSLALGVLFESAWQHLADTADEEGRGYLAAFSRFPFLEGLLRELPTAWDESTLLAGDPDHHVIVARRRGDRWWLAGIQAGDSSWQADVDLSPIGCQRDSESGPRLIRIVSQGAKVDELRQEELEIGCRLVVELLPRGGFVATLEAKSD